MNKNIEDFIILLDTLPRQHFMLSQMSGTTEVAEHWTSEVIREYLASVQKEREDGTESDEAMSTESESEGDSLSASPPSSVTSAFSSIALYDIAHPDDIASDDSAFSSEDEFSDEQTRAERHRRRELVLGRAPPHLLKLRGRELVDMHEAYMKQLDDADAELAELTGAPREAVVRRPVTTEYHEPPSLKGPDAEAIVRELRMRSRKDIHETEKPDLVRGLVLLAQALFRRERRIKHIRRERGDMEAEEDY
ncbi:hypothetical protein WOLCODRAFT_165764 [Wolfiporia cocos MD-104 SS10]|uniref:Uncharacterized protein n=1 Tax=Wolfiporia cocos (strain MD-104) TaxID=742152 RepID=A0A2H3IXI6_WOLCO|nr:hypothetical protein WOLCODRAFT_165764 [Wolfiporia cocos MD-104 SS10]